MASESEADADESAEDEENKPPEEADEAQGEGEEQQAQDSAQREAADDTSDDAEDGAMDTVEAPSSELDDEGEAGEAAEAAENRPPQPNPAERRGPDYKAFTDPVRRNRRRRRFVRPRRIAALARISRQAVAEPVLGRRAPRQPSAAAADGAAEPLVGIRPRGGGARQRAPVAGHHRFAAAVVLQAGEGHGVPRHGGDAAARQFRLDARAADHGRGDLRRHSRPHARALRRQGRDSGLHHPGVEGRAVARGMAAGRQARQPRPAQRSAPPDLQGRRRALAARAQEPRPDDARGAA